MSFMSRMWHNAEEILEVARAAAPDSPEYAFVRTAGECWEMIAGAGWSLDALLSDRGATEVYRVRRQGKTISVEGRTGLQSCRLESVPPQGTVRPLPAPIPLYDLVPPMGVLRPAETALLPPAA